MGGIIRRLRGRRKIKDEALAFTISERISNKHYEEIPGVFGPPAQSTRIVQAFYDASFDKIVDVTPPSALPGETAEYRS